MTPHPLHLQILREIKKLRPKSSDLRELQWVQKYLGSNKIYHGLSAPRINSLAKKIVGENRLSPDETVKLLNSLYRDGQSYTEISLAAAILSLSKELLQNFDPQNLDMWLNYTHGWAENDVLCQSMFTPEIILTNWSNWLKIIKKFNRGKNINKRRASIVLLVKSLRQSADPRFSQLAFANIENLKGEKDILITKAVSWGLRALIQHHKSEVLVYLEKNRDTLPKIAYRETFNKLTTGRKNHVK